MKFLFLIIISPIFCTVTGLSPYALAADPTPTDAKLASELLSASDISRGGIKTGLEWNIQLQTVEEGSTSDRQFTVSAFGDDALVKALAPAKYKGEVYLFNNHNMWFFKPSLKKPVAISSRQKLSGQAANGDIASTNYFRDYDPSMEKYEVFNGEKCAVLLLKAKTNSVTYDQIRYWISLNKKLAMQAEFLTLQGQPFKRADFEYGNKVTFNGSQVPFISKMTIVDAKFKDNKSIITYEVPKLKNLTKSVFNINNLSR